MLLIIQPCKLVRDPWGHGSIKGGKDVAGEKGGQIFGQLVMHIIRERAINTFSIDQISSK